MLLLPDNLRYERKFVAQGLSLAEVLAIVRRHPGLFREAYPPRYVNNIYMDSPERGDYHDHISGLPNRSKTRVRWYGASRGHVAGPVLEHKVKRGQVSGKLSYALPAFWVNGEGPGRLLAEALRTATLPEQVRARLHGREPVLFNRYRRHYFVSGDGRFRLTVDSELQFGSADGSPDAQALSAGPWSPIVELKFAASAAGDVDRVTNSLPFRLVRCSKYILGLERLALAGLPRGRAADVS